MKKEVKGTVDQIGRQVTYSKDDKGDQMFQSLDSNY